MGMESVAQHFTSVHICSKKNTKKTPQRICKYQWKKSTLYDTVSRRLSPNLPFIPAHPLSNVSSLSENPLEIYNNKPLTALAGSYYPFLSLSYHCSHPVANILEVVFCQLSPVAIGKHVKQVVTTCVLYTS